MQICATCGARNIDGLQVCWQCRRPLGQAAPAEAGALPSPPPRYPTRPRGIRPSVGLLMLVVFAAGIGAWWYLRPPEAIELPLAFEGEPVVNRRISLRVAELARDHMDIGIGIARYGRTDENFPRYAIIAFRDLHPPFTADYLLRDFQSYIPVRAALRSELVLERTIDGVRFRCHRVRQLETHLPQPGATFRWCSWHVGDEAGIVVDRVSRQMRGTLELTQRVHALVK